MIREGRVRSPRATLGSVAFPRRVFGSTLATCFGHRAINPSFPRWNREWQLTQQNISLWKGYLRAFTSLRILANISHLHLPVHTSVTAHTYFWSHRDEIPWRVAKILMWMISTNLRASSSFSVQGKCCNANLYEDSITDFLQHSEFSVELFRLVCRETILADIGISDKLFTIIVKERIKGYILPNTVEKNGLDEVNRHWAYCNPQNS